MFKKNYERNALPSLRTRRCMTNNQIPNATFLQGTYVETYLMDIPSLQNHNRLRLSQVCLHIWISNIFRILLLGVVFTIFTCQGLYSAETVDITEKSSLQISVFIFDNHSV